jgi:ABC-type Fe3+/spermidine/putrescine transport system ATPase subunit
MSKLELDRVAKSYGAFRAIDDVSLAVESGETLVLLGSSGCGKTTLLRLIAGFLRPDQGTIRIGGRTVAGDAVMVAPERRSLSMVFQSYAVWPHKTVFENLAYGLRLRKLDAGTVRGKVEQSLVQVQMDAYAQRYPAELSGGQQQRVALARALVLEPEILLFDEPLSNLDAGLREHMRFEIKGLLTKLGITGIYVTHDQNEAMVIGDRIAVMNRGRIEQVGTAEDIYYNSRTEFVAKFVGLANVYDAEVVGPAGPDLIRVKVGGMGEVLARHPAPAAAARAVRLFVRPEGVRLTRHEGGEGNLVRGRVVRRTFLGAYVDLIIELDGVAMRVISSSEDAPYRVDEEALVSLSPQSCLVLAVS